ncbi:NnrU family protein [Pseudophaeobacter sp. TrK17]|uniref:NnrU family protein n=1 Tax=Pseudophaeobacter sp. TrK17 TaxID=2815167 RepID=UPI0035CFC293
MRVPWNCAPWQNHFVLAVMVVVCLLLTFSVGKPNPFSFGDARNDRFDPNAPGIVRFSRHPLLLALCICAFVFCICRVRRGGLSDHRQAQVATDGLCLVRSVDAGPSSADHHLSKITCSARGRSAAVSYVDLVPPPAFRGQSTAMMHQLAAP